MSYEYNIMVDDLMGELLAVNSMGLLTNGALSLAAAVFTALALYTLASSRGIRKAWMAWIPVVNVWILGSYPTSPVMSSEGR